MPKLKPVTRDEFIERYAALWGIDKALGRSFAEPEWDRLTRAGLVEEERKPGWYWGKPFGGLCIMEFDGKEWRSARGAVWFGTADPCPIIGPRICEPKE